MLLARTHARAPTCTNPLKTWNLGQLLVLVVVSRAERWETLENQCADN